MGGRDMAGAPLQPGVNVDRIDLQAGLAQAARFGYASAEDCMVVDYALARHARGEEEGAQQTALSHGIDLTSWYAILAAARAGTGDRAIVPATTGADLIEQERTRQREAEVREAERRSLESSRWHAGANVESAVDRLARLAVSPHVTRSERDAALDVVKRLNEALRAADALGRSLRGEQ